MADVWEDRSITDTNEAFVLLILADYANGTNCCWPAVATIAARARMSVRGVQKIISRLLVKQKIEITNRGGGAGSTNTYRLTYQITPNDVRGKTPHGVQGSLAIPEPGTGLTPNPVRGRVNHEVKNPEPGSPDPKDPSLIPKKRYVPLGSPEPGTGLQNGTFEDYRKRLFELYGRPDSQRLTQMEVSNLRDLIEQRVEFSQEIEQVRLFKEKSDPKFFPRGLLSLVEKWQATLDRARSYDPQHDNDVPAHVQLKAIDREIEQHPANRESTYFRADCPMEKRAELKELRQKRDQVNRRIALG